MTDPLERLLIRAGIDNMQRHLWFEGVRLVGSALLVPTEGAQRTIERCFLPQILERCGVTLTTTRVFGAEAPRVIEAPRKSKPPLWKKGKEPAGWGKRREPDLLD